jgi:alcohol dehydrogenase
MRAAVAPAVNGKWEVKDVAKPEAGPNQVLIKIHASGICYTDVHETKGHIPGNFPRIMGHEPVGEIVAVGAGVTTRKVGDRVGVPWVQATDGTCEWCRRGKQMFCANAIVTGIQSQGGHAEFMPAYAAATMVLPEKLSYEQAAPIFCAGYTVWSGLQWADPKPGERVAVLGIGGLGHLAVQYAKAAGFETIAISHSPDKDKLIRKLGADEIVRDGKGLAKMGGADIVLSTSNSSDAMADTLQALRPDGRLVLMGVEGKAIPVQPGEMLGKRIRILGSQQNGPQYLHEALAIAATGRVKVMTETYGLKEAVRAYERVEKGEARFRAVLTI